MIKKIFLSIVLVFTLLVPALPAAHAINPTGTAEGSLGSTEFQFILSGDDASGGIVHPAITGGEKQSWVRKGINFLFEKAVSVMAAVIGTAAILMMAVGGFQILISAGDQTMYDRGKNKILYAVIGLAVVLGAYILVTAVQLAIKTLYG